MLTTILGCNLHSKIRMQGAYIKILCNLKDFLLYCNKYFHCFSLVCVTKNSVQLSLLEVFLLMIVLKQDTSILSELANCEPGLILSSIDSSKNEDLYLDRTRCFSERNDRQTLNEIVLNIKYQSLKPIHQFRKISLINLLIHLTGQVNVHFRL